MTKKEAEQNITQSLKSFFPEPENEEHIQKSVADIVNHMIKEGMIK